MTGPADPPAGVRALAERRAAARADRDFPAADALRAEIAAAGWLVRDVAHGWELARKPSYDVLAGLTEMSDRSAEPAVDTVSVSVLAEGWPADVTRCLTAVLTHTDAAVMVLDAGNVDGAGDAVHEVASAHPERVTAWHLAVPCGWGPARGALLRADRAAVQVWVDPSVEPTGNVVQPLLVALDEPGAVVAGGWGVDLDADWHGVHDARPGRVDAVLGYLLAVRRSAALAVGGPDPRAVYYRNADLEFCLALRAAGGHAVMTDSLPAVRHRHRGYHDVDPAYRERESRRTYARLLRRFREGERDARDR